MLNRPASEFLSSIDTDFDVIVLGAGVVGINTAYWAMRAGRKVCVVDRQPGAGLETSFANGGQISVSHAEPWANPSAPLKILKWLFDDRSPLLFRPKLDIHQWLWIAQFLVDCLPQRADRHTTEIVRLATESRRLLREIREREDLHYDQRRQGILHFYRDQREFDAAIQVTELMREHGCNRNVIGRSEVLAIEPAFEARINEVWARLTLPRTRAAMPTNIARHWLRCAPKRAWLSSMDQRQWLSMHRNLRNAWHPPRFALRSDISICGDETSWSA